MIDRPIKIRFVGFPAFERMMDGDDEDQQRKATKQGIAQGEEAQRQGQACWTG